MLLIIRVYQLTSFYIPDYEHLVSAFGSCSKVFLAVGAEQEESKESVIWSSYSAYYCPLVKGDVVEHEMPQR